MLLVLTIAVNLVQLEFAGESLRMDGDPCQGLQVKGQEVFPVVTDVSRTVNFVRLLVPIAARYLLEHVNT